MVSLDNIIARDNYLVDGSTGEKVVFYECDPEKNTECNKMMCRASEANEADGALGFCSKTVDPKFRKDGGKAWYCVMKTKNDGSEPYWGREYIEG